VMPTTRPILFSGAMVRALLDGRKTQTRRVVKAPKGLSNPADFLCVRPGGVNWKDEPVGPAVAFGPRDAVEWAYCPYGTIGDRLWVRETWAELALYSLDAEGVQEYRTVYRADGEADGLALVGDRWRPSIHMPRWASRITLEITGVRVERVADISEADAVAEGVGAWREEWSEKEKAEAFLLSATGQLNVADPNTIGRRLYRMLWDSINGGTPGCSWVANPWVWALEFRRVESGATQ
jgi:hypothetical protein